MKYRTLIDLPMAMGVLRSGVIGKFDGNKDYIFSYNFPGDCVTYPKSVVESHPEWFVRVEEKEFTESEVLKLGEMACGVMRKLNYSRPYKECLPQAIADYRRERDGKK